MASVRFAWNPLLVDLRRELCPGAQWNKQARQWLMSDSEATSFLQGAQVRLDFGRSQAQICVDGTVWIVGFVHGAPYRLPAEAMK